MSALKSITYEYMDNVDDIDDELKCLICKYPLRSPVSHTLCHYDFCQDCIDIWLKDIRACPACEQSLDNNMEQDHPRVNLMEIFSFTPISTRIVLNRLDKLLVRCLLCGEINIQRSDFEDHEQICMKKIIKCQSIDMKCPWKGTRDKLDRHLKICIFQKIRPIINKIQRKMSTIETKQIKMKSSIKKFEKQMSFILAFINEGIPMNKHCTIPSNQCRYKSIDQWNSLKVFSCRMCDQLFECNQISIHACDDGAICHLCFHEHYPKNVTKTDLQCSYDDKEDFSSISTLQSS
jgi:hypothetical protein